MQVAKKDLSTSKKEKELPVFCGEMVELGRNQRRQPPAHAFAGVTCSIMGFHEISRLSGRECMVGSMNRGNGVCWLTAMPARCREEGDLELKKSVQTTASMGNRADGLRGVLEEGGREKSRESPEI